jgi:hypothetical protein
LDRSGRTSHFLSDQFGANPLDDIRRGAESCAKGRQAVPVCDVRAARHANVNSAEATGGSISEFIHSRYLIGMQRQSSINYW